jgi:hypothetical protein
VANGDVWGWHPQIGIDENDQNAAKNEKGTVEAVFTPERDSVSTASPFVPYSEVFGLQRFRESELIHGMFGKGSELLGKGSHLGRGTGDQLMLPGSNRCTHQQTLMCFVWMQSQVAGPCLPPWVPSLLRPPLVSPGKHHQVLIWQVSQSWISHGRCVQCIWLGHSAMQG